MEEERDMDEERDMEEEREREEERNSNTKFLAAFKSRKKLT